MAITRQSKKAADETSPKPKKTKITNGNAIKKQEQNLPKKTRGAVQKIKGDKPVLTDKTNKVQTKSPKVLKNKQVCVKNLQKAKHIPIWKKALDVEVAKSCDVYNISEDKDFLKEEMAKKATQKNSKKQALTKPLKSLVLKQKSKKKSALSSCSVFLGSKTHNAAVSKNSTKNFKANLLKTSLLKNSSVLAEKVKMPVSMEGSAPSKNTQKTIKDKENSCMNFESEDMDDFTVESFSPKLAKIAKKHQQKSEGKEVSKTIPTQSCCLEPKVTVLSLSGNDSTCTEDTPESAFNNSYSKPITTDDLNRQIDDLLNSLPSTGFIQRAANNSVDKLKNAITESPKKCQQPVKGHFMKKAANLDTDSSSTIRPVEETPEKAPQVELSLDGFDFSVPQMTSTPDSSVSVPCTNPQPSCSKYFFDFEDKVQSPAFEGELFESPCKEVSKSDHKKKQAQPTLKFKKHLFQNEECAPEHRKLNSSLPLQKECKIAGKMHIENRKSYSPNLSVRTKKSKVPPQKPFRTKTDRLIESMNQHFSEIEDMELCIE